mmetsp:Transcript_17873/g.30366  ORF Transcript_17873/g.30366 Transcript_17873/m.30366 type:complete len:122 (+) Transcript_17873:1755-2120(+)
MALKVQESLDSTSKKLIYQFPFSQIPLLSSVLKQLEGSQGHLVYIDVEINDLEDAYINIARDEERLLLESQQNQAVQRVSQVNDIEREGEDINFSRSVPLISEQSDNNELQQVQRFMGTKA